MRAHRVREIRRTGGSIFLRVGRSLVRQRTPLNDPRPRSITTRLRRTEPCRLIDVQRTLID